MKSTKTLMLAAVAAFALGSAAMAQSEMPSPNQGSAYQGPQQIAPPGYSRVQAGSSDARTVTTTYSGDYSTGVDYTTLANPG